METLSKCMEEHNAIIKEYEEKRDKLQTLLQQIDKFKN